MIVTRVIGGHTQRRTPQTQPLPMPPPHPRKEFSSTCNWRNYLSWSKTSYINYVTFDLYKPSWNFSRKFWHPPAVIYGSKSNLSAEEHEIQTLMTVNNIVLWEVTPRCMAQIYRRFGVTYLRRISTGLHVVTSEETVLFSHSTGSFVWYSTFRGTLIVMYSYNEIQRDELFLRFIW